MRRLLLLPLLLSGLLLTCKDTTTDPDTGPDLSRIRALLETVNIDSLTRTVRDLSGEQITTVGGREVHIFSRRTGSEGNQIAAQYLLERLSGYGLTASYHRTDQTRPNVIASKPGLMHPEKRIIISAHFDNISPTDTIPGADDNASGTAAVIEAARLLSGFPTDATVIFALFNEEEQGLIGSAEYALGFKTTEVNDLFVINLDMVGWDYDNDHVLEIHTREVGASVALADTLVFLNASLGLGLNTIVHMPGTNRSDHASFWTHNLSAVLLIEEMYGGDFNAYYHSPNDLIMHFNMDFFLKAAQLGIGAAALLAGIPSPAS